ncbi:TlyA family RNA methyltransferase [Pararhizobium mangrovi]|uniref:TlyA family RNA methyltransferase n=2 Tax=Pararhizobium mangrovi TaxID=2590452 RepID=A0A506TYF9_9HYPH|nr:TlyA family RNA methyltransferase [Pararhizobium mangrovi]
MAEAPARTRLDQLLVARGDFETRSRARDAIARGTVSVNGAPAAKPGMPVADDVTVAIADPARGYVSRAALKLVAGLDAFGLDPAGRTALDVGASTGGFTQVLLERGAASVHAIDVGHDQFHPSIAGDPRVIGREGLNARDLTSDDLGGATIDCIVSDVSFVSLKLALPPALDLATAGAFAVLLVKPQFEAGRERIGRGGMLKDTALAPVIAEELRSWLDTCPGWTSLGVARSPIEGGDGNREFLLAGRKA